MKLVRNLVLALAGVGLGLAMWAPGAAACTVCAGAGLCEEGDYEWCFSWDPGDGGGNHCNFGGRCLNEEEVALSDISPTGFFASDADEFIVDQVAGVLTTGCAGLAVGLLPDNQEELEENLTQ